MNRRTPWRRDPASWIVALAVRRLHHRWATVSVEGSTVRYRQCRACGQEYAFASRGRPLPPPRVF